MSEQKKTKKTKAKEPESQNGAGKETQAVSEPKVASTEGKESKKSDKKPKPETTPEVKGEQQAGTEEPKKKVVKKKTEKSQETKVDVKPVEASAAEEKPKAEEKIEAAAEPKKKEVKKKPETKVEKPVEQAKPTETEPPKAAAPETKKKLIKKTEDKKVKESTDKDEKTEDPKSQTGNEDTQVAKTEDVSDQQLLDLLKFSRISQKQESKEHKFWNTQPVPQFEEKDAKPGPIEVKTLDDVRKEPYELSPGYVWAPIDMNNAATVDDVYNLLTENYVEDDDNMFRFDYSRNFLAWALKPPGYHPEWHVGVRAKSTSGKLVGFITGIPVNVRVGNDTVAMAEINFLCVHKRLRTKRLAPVLIKEVTRRVNLKGVWQAVYTAGVVLPRPIAKNRYWHRSLNPKKLVEVGFSRLPPRMTFSRLIKLYKLHETTKTPGLRPLTKRDCGRAMKLLMAYLSKFQLTQVFDAHELEHWLLPRDDVIYSYVVEDPATHEITDLVSFYSLPSSIIGNDKYTTLRAAYSFYNVANKTPWLQLVHDALILARNAGFDVFNALNVMENEQVFKELKFGIGDGNLQYYLYNWRHPELTPNQVGMVLL